MARIRSTAVIAAIGLAFVAGVLVGPSVLSTATAGMPGPTEGTMPNGCSQMHAQCEAMMEGMDHEAMHEQCQAMMESMNHDDMHQMCQGMMSMMDGDMMNGMDGMHNMMRGMMGR